MSKIKYLNLFSTCIPVKGFRRSIIYDISRNTYKLIPNDLFNILQEFKKLGKEEIINKYVEHYVTVNEYIDFLIKNEFAFETSSPESFPELSLKINIPYLYTNIIIRFNAEIDYSKLIYEIENVGIPALLLTFEDEVTIAVIETFLNHFYYSRLKHIELVINYNNCLDFDAIMNLCKKHLRINRVVIYNSKFIKNYPFHSNKYAEIIFTNDSFDFSKGCLFNRKFFTINHEFFFEARTFNSCLYKKICIDQDGNINNCIANNNNTFNINKHTLENVYKNRSFKKLWNISKDQIEVCKDCEFRYLCPDCRAFLKDPGNIYSQPAKCEYNPYIAKWKGEEGYVPIEECGRYIEGKFVLFAEKISELNKEIWG